MIEILMNEKVIYEEFSEIFEKLEREQKRLERIEKLKRIIEEDEFKR